MTNYTNQDGKTHFRPRREGDEADRYKEIGYLLEPGVHPRPLQEWPKQILRGKCGNCGVELALPDDDCCIACYSRVSK